MNISLRAETPQQRALWAIGICPWLVGIWRYFLDPAFVQEKLSDWFGPGVSTGTGGLVGMGATCVLLGLIPALLVRFVFRESLVDYGLGLGDRFRTARSFLIVLPIVIGGTYASSLDHDIATHFPLNPAARQSLAWFCSHVAAYICFYIGWEFFFRGFMQRALTPAYGLGAAVMIQTMASALGHLDSLPEEMFASILGGLFWGWLAFRTRSILSGMLQHATLGIALDAFICLRAEGYFG